jgi:hypothetical protein
MILYADIFAGGTIDPDRGACDLVCRDGHLSMKTILLPVSVPVLM